MARRGRHAGRHAGNDRRAPIPLFGADQRQQGLRAFQAGRFDDAIAAWSGLARGDGRVTAALAEAHFRRALTLPPGVDRLADVRRAVELAPGEPRYQYHLGLALHHAHDIPAAIDCYRAVLGHNPAWPGAGMALALAALEQDVTVDLAALPGSTPTLRLALAPVQALLRGQPVSAQGNAPLERLWQGLSLLGRDARAARAALDDGMPLLSARAGAVRQYYRGVAAAASGDLDVALSRWKGAYAEGLRRPWLADNLAAATLRVLDASPADAADALARAAAITPDILALAAASPALAEAVIGALDRGARVAATAGDWTRATELWEAARGIVSAGTGLGSPRPLLHNLALAYEAQDRWMEAAEAWRAMLRTRPRRRAAEGAPARAGKGKAGKRQADQTAPAVSAASDAGAAGGVLSEAQWAWVRRRVIECYKRAGQPAEAVAVFRQALKADPDDVELRLQLADALLANGQEQAAYNEVRRAAEVAPENDDAQLRLAGIQLERGERRAAEQILRQVLRRRPDHADARRLLARLYLESGQDLQAGGQYAAAVRNLEEGRALAPDDYQFPLTLARVAIDQGKRKEVAALLERALELGADQSAAYMGVLECWAVIGDIAAARAVVARAGATLPPNPAFYVDAGVILLRIAAAPTLPYASVLSAARGKGKDEDAWRSLGAELLERGMALRPDDGRMRASVAAELLQARPELALRYAEEAARLLPDELPVLIMLGMAQALNERKREAKETLQRAARTARRQGNAAMAQEIEMMRRQVDSPLLPLILSMSSPFGPSPDEDDLYW